MFGLYPKVFYGDRKGQKNIFKPALPACIWDNDQAFDPFHRRAVCDWNGKELVPFTSASNCKFCPVMTGTRRHRGCLLWVWLDFEKQLWTPNMGTAKCFLSTQSGGLQEPVPVGSWSLRLQPGLLGKAGSAEHWEMCQCRQCLSAWALLFPARNTSSLRNSISCLKFLNYLCPSVAIKTDKDTCLLMQNGPALFSTAHSYRVF